MTGIYMWTSPSGKSYIGQAMNLKKRKYVFLLNPFKYNYSHNGNTKIDRARKKYNDFSQWKYTILCECSVDELNELEEYYIDKYDTYVNGYNLTKGGDGVKGKIFTQEEIEHRRQVMKDKYKNGYVCPFKGKEHTEDTRKIISESLKGDKHPNWGKTTPDEVKQKLHQRMQEQGRCYAIFQCDMNGNVINEYSSIREAARRLNLKNTNIIKALKGKYNHCGGFKWKYKNPPMAS